MNKNIFVFLLFIPIIIFFIGCKSQTIQLDTNLIFFDNNVVKILFDTKPGCSKTNFKFTEEYKKIDTSWNDCYAASSFEEYENTIKKYFEMDLFETIVQEYFNENILIVVILSAHDSKYYKNGKFEKGENNNFIYKVGLYNSANVFKYSNKCIYTKVFIYEMNKYK
ncbi:MAG: hypothetical protein LBH43_04180 [Treponema sp.]|jgi:hypothetical protein|nr:hypothetical protein [Treponema sp.]